MRQIGGDRKAVSNVIVAMLSLVLVVVIVANVVLWSYQMNQFDWERMQEDLKITDVLPVFSSSWFTAESEYALNVGSIENGTYIDTQTVNAVSETLKEGLRSQEERLCPNDAGQYAQWNDAYPGGTAHWDCCNEEPPDEDGSYVENNAASWKKESYNLENHTGSGTINWVRVYVRARLTQAGTSAMRTLIRTYDNDYESDDISLTTSYQDVYTEYDMNPSTGSEWTWNETDSLQAGASSRKSEGEQNIRMTAVWVIVDYWIPGGQRIDFDGAFSIDLSTYPLADIQTVEIKLRYKADDTNEDFFLKTYNWTASAYGDFGFNNTSGHTPTSTWDTYTVDLTDRWRSYVSDSGAIYVKLQDSQPDANMTTIDVDFLAVRAVINGTKLIFRNKGSLTCHLISLWVNNSTHHIRHDINIVINAGETITHIQSDTPLPDKPYIIKIVTERGNIAVYS
jgi:hypothetical protein